MPMEGGRVAKVREIDGKQESDNGKTVRSRIGECSLPKPRQGTETTIELETVVVTTALEQGLPRNGRGSPQEASGGLSVDTRRGGRPGVMPEPDRVGLRGESSRMLAPIGRMLSLLR